MPGRRPAPCHVAPCHLQPLPGEGRALGSTGPSLQGRRPEPSCGVTSHQLHYHDFTELFEDFTRIFPGFYFETRVLGGPRKASGGPRELLGELVRELGPGRGTRANEAPGDAYEVTVSPLECHGTS